MLSHLRFNSDCNSYNYFKWLCNLTEKPMANYVLEFPSYKSEFQVYERFDMAEKLNAK